MAKNKKVGVHGTDEETGRASGDGTGGQQKTPCPVTRAQFGKAPVVTVQFLVNGQVVAAQSATPRTFSTGSLGWYTGDKIEVPVDGVPCKCTVGLNVTVVNSKELPQ